MNNLNIYFISVFAIVITYLFLYLSALFFIKTKLLKIEKREYLKNIFNFGIFYYVKTLKQSGKIIKDNINEKNAILYKTISIILSIIHILCMMSLVIFIAFNIKNSYFSKSYYDLYGNIYESKNSIVYYDESMNKYTPNYDDFTFEEVGNFENIISARNCYIDKNGFFVILDSSELTYDKSVPFENPYCFYDTKNNYYADAITSYWDKDGKLVRL